MAAYYDRTMASAMAKLELSKLDAVKDTRRSKDGTYVFKIAGGGEAMVEGAGAGKVRVRLFKGKCPC
jgi:hypothetical protein